MYQRINNENQLAVEILEEQPIKQATSPIQLRISARVKKKNPKYANIIMVEEKKRTNIL